MTIVGNNLIIRIFGFVMRSIQVPVKGLEFDLGITNAID